MHRQIQTVGFSLCIHTQRGHKACEFDQNEGHDEGENPDDGKAAQLSCPGTGAEQRNHDRAKNPADTMNREHVQRIINLQDVTDQAHRLLTENPGHRADNQRLDRTSVRSGSMFDLFF